MIQQNTNSMSGQTGNPLPNLSSVRERERLTAPGLKAYFRIMDSWQVGQSDEAELLGVSVSTARRMKANVLAGRPVQPLGMDQLTRISLIIGIVKSLRIIHSDRIATTWMTTENSNALFRGRPPIRYALEGGIPALSEIRQLVDSRRGMLA